MPSEGEGLPAPPKTAPGASGPLRPPRPRLHHSHQGLAHANAHAGTHAKHKAPSALSLALPEAVRRFDVLLEPAGQVYFSGQSVRGHVRVDLATCVTLQGITVRLVGEAAVRVVGERDGGIGTGTAWTARRLRRAHRKIRNRISPAAVSDSAAAAAAAAGAGAGAGAGVEAGAARAESPGGRCRACQVEDTADAWASAAGAHLPLGSLAARDRLRDRNAHAGGVGTTRSKSQSSQQEQSCRFRAYEKYFEHKFYVFGHKYSSRREQLWAGAHRFAFEYALPNKLPASFLGRCGYVRYFCEAALERAGCAPLARRAIFSVSNVADLNTEPKAEGGARAQRSSNSCLFCCRRGTVIAAAAIKRSGVAPGEALHVTADVLNMSDRRVHKTCARITQVVTYSSSKGFRRQVEEAWAAEARRGAVAPGEQDAWCEVPLRVPPLPPTSRFTAACKLIDVDYRLDFVVDLDGEPLQMRLPLWVGTVPLQREFAALRPAGDAAPEREPHPPVAFPAATLHKYPDLPVAYSDPCELRVGNAGGGSGAGFVARYPTYRSRDSFVQALLRRAATDIPRIVVTQPPGCCARHRHLAPPPPHAQGASRRHSAPEALSAPPRHVHSAPSSPARRPPPLRPLPEEDSPPTQPPTPPQHQPPTEAPTQTPAPAVVNRASETSEFAERNSSEKYKQEEVS